MQEKCASNIEHWEFCMMLTDLTKVSDSGLFMLILNALSTSTLYTCPRAMSYDGTSLHCHKENQTWHILAALLFITFFAMFPLVDFKDWFRDSCPLLHRWQLMSSSFTDFRPIHTNNFQLWLTDVLYAGDCALLAHCAWRSATVGWICTVHS